MGKIIAALHALVVVCAVAVANAQTLVKSDDGTGLHIYFRSGWASPNIHYNTGSGWTTSPGVKMTATTDRVRFPSEAGWFQFDIAAPQASLEFVFNNGAGIWDNNKNNNYKVTAAGSYVVTSTVATPPNPVVQVKSNDGTGLHVFFRTAWTGPFIHYNKGSGWTTSPGDKLATSTDALFPAADGWFQADFAAPQASLEFVFNNGAGTWDNNNSNNYKVSSAGTFAFTSALTTPPYSLSPSSPTPAPTPTTTTPATTTTTPTTTAPPTTPAPTTSAPTTAPTPTPPGGITVPPAPTTTPAPSTTCSNYNGQDSCSGNNVDSPASSEDRRWQTPSRNSSLYRSTYQDYRSLQGYAHVVYAAGRQSATVTVRTVLRVPTSTCSYSFNGASQTSNTFTAATSLTSDLNIVVTCSSGSNTWTLALDPVNFVWQNAAVPTPSGLEGGQKGAIVDLFGWPYADIEQECKDFLGKAGYLGVKINPPQEAVMSDAWPQSGQRNPWYFVYQPVSYRLVSRMGTRAQLRSMIQTCRANGVRVYADAVVNHMAGGGNDVNPLHRNPSGGGCTTWGPKSSVGGSPYYTHNFAFGTNPETGLRAAAEFPAIPFGPSDFHCERSLNAYTDPLILSAGWLEGLLDLHTGKTNVRERIAQYFVDLVGIGFSGFRIDAIKHIGPVDTAAIFGLLNQYMGGSLPADFLMWGEVILGGEAQMLACNKDSGYNFYEELDSRYAAAGLSATDISKLKIWSSDYPKEMPVCGRWILPASRFVIQNDDHDQQQQGSTSRDMGDKGSVLVKNRDVGAHRNFELQLFTRRDADWKIKVVLSSFTLFPDNTPAGFPDGYSDCAKGFDPSAGQKCTLSVPYEKAFRAGSCGYTVEGFASVGKYTRVHRDLQIVNAMRSWTGQGSVSASQVGITGSC
jgi:alpha-amylase